ncbi:MAG: glycogen synthase GlgA [Candidatus Saganbacteria bacterium]|nr:glycogen synthase GlgA [Candidatus Saganbacteria bacterium]
MKILYVSSEVVPFAKTGGLADVAGALPKALVQIGHDVRIILPRYKMVSLEKYPSKLIIEDLIIKFGTVNEKVNIYETKIPGTEVIVYLVDNDKFFGSRDQLYQVKGEDYPDNLERFVLFSKAVLVMLREINWQPHVIHCNDWQSALVCLYLKVTFGKDPFFARTASVYSIHNMAYMGIFPGDKFNLLDLPKEEFTPEKLEYWGNIALAKAGLVYADVINTVSETYAKEIQTTEFGYGLDGILRSRTKDVYGIVNGIDCDLWNPATDPIIAKHYNANTVSMKSANKLKLQADNKLPQDEKIPVLGIVSRLAKQKGFDILAQAFSQMMEMDLQFILLGDGEPQYQNFFVDAAKKYPKKLAINLGFNAALAQEIYAGSDLFLMPSHYEPCGLGQLISFRYGTIPLVRKTGGLADTVHEFDPKTGEGDGFIFERTTDPFDFLDAVKRALTAFQNKKAWESLQKKVMDYNYSWDTSAKKYVWLYKKALEKIGL